MRLLFTVAYVTLPRLPDCVCVIRVRRFTRSFCLRFVPVGWFWLISRLFPVDFACLLFSCVPFALRVLVSVLRFAAHFGLVLVTARFGYDCVSLGYVALRSARGYYQLFAFRCGYARLTFTTARCVCITFQLRLPFHLVTLLRFWLRLFAHVYPVTPRSYVCCTFTFTFRLPFVTGLHAPADSLRYPRHVAVVILPVCRWSARCGLRCGLHAGCCARYAVTVCVPSLRYCTVGYRTFTRLRTFVAVISRLLHRSVRTFGYVCVILYRRSCGFCVTFTAVYWFCRFPPFVSQLNVYRTRTTLVCVTQFIS